MELKYDLDIYLKSFNNSDISYFETALPLKGKEIQTLFPIEEIIAVTNYGLDVIYEEGKDYIIKDKKLVITENSRIKQTLVDEYYRKEPDSLQINVDKKKCHYRFNEQRYLLFGEQDYITRRQIAITYRHKPRNAVFTQKNQKDQLNRFFNKLEKEKKATIVFYGDSLTEGYNSSGTPQGGNIKPHAPSWPMMVTEYLEKRYNAKINYVNTAVGGTNTKWGIENHQERVNQYHPDLLVLEFGMNDGMLSKEEHALQIKEIINGVRKDNPNCDIVLLSPSLINPESTWACGYQNEYIDEYQRFGFDHLAIVNITEAHKSLLKRKAFRDMTGNNINHPNDFLVRVYARAVLQAIGY